MRLQGRREGEGLRLGDRDVRYVRCWKSDLFAETHEVVDESGKRIVLKRARLLGFLAARERAIYRRLAGLDGIAALDRAQGEHWLAHDFVPGETLQSVWQRVRTRREGPRILAVEPHVPADFYDRLEALVRAVHARGVIALDLHKRDNIIVRPDGTPALIDFQVSLWFAQPRSPLWRPLFDALVRADLYQVWKHRRRHGFARDDDEARAGLERGVAHGLHHALVRAPWLAIRRRFLPRWW